MLSLIWFFKKEVAMSETLFLIILGHFVGDFFFQHKKMADNKNKKGTKGSLWCAFHVFVYSFFVCLFAQNFSFLFFFGVLMPHFAIDRWSLAYKWMLLTKASERLNSQSQIDSAFGVAIYIVIDQVMHIATLYLLFLFTY